MFISDPGFRILDPRRAIKEERKIFFVLIFFCATNFTELKIILFLNRYHTERNLSQLTKNYCTFCPKNRPKLLKIWVGDLGSGKKPFRIPRSKRHQIPDPQHCILSEDCNFSESPDPDPRFLMNKN